ncbi:MarR family winged helix-turn-helix transcriptional regulator [Fictibacillus iocasae]|uniref:MarR family winged helix-turn-helix transcriptional regulator n=1 Tax=Fictibacillus iocasae TaxID=2715437 RepID=A0ABW2NM60_9BACL
MKNTTKDEDVTIFMTNINRNELSNELEHSFRTVFRTFRKEINDLFSDYMPGNEFAVLKALYDNSPLMASEIASEVKVSSSHITAVTDRLVKKGLIVRTRSEEDRRIVFLEITMEGKDIARKMENIKHDYLVDKFNRLTSEEMKTMISLFNKLL